MRRFWFGSMAVLGSALAAGCDDSPTLPRAEPSACAESVVAAPLHPFDAETLGQRRADFMQDLGNGIAWFPGFEVPSGSGRQESDFYYFTGLDSPEAWLVLVARDDGPDEALLYVEPLAAGAAGIRADEVTGIDDVRCLLAAATELDSLFTVAETTHLLAVAPSLFLDETGHYLDRLETWPGPVLNTSNDRFGHRVVKDAEEQDRLRRTARISVGGLLAGMALVGAGAYEGDVLTAVESAFADSGAARTAFGSIVASGANTLVLHYRDAADTMRAGDVVVLDVGAEHARYAGDVARTLPVSGVFTPRQREIYDILVEARQAVLDAFAAGLSPNEAEEAFTQVYAERWETCGSWCYNFMPHLLFHPVGLDVHDRRPIPGNIAGVVLNVEPGLYFPGEGFGMRIEDTVLLTGNGYVLLTDGLPTTADEIEAFMAEQATLDQTDEPE